MRKDLILINKNHKVAPTYLERIKLVTINNVDNDPILLEEETATAYKNLKQFLLEKNIELAIDSAYRSLEKQQQIYDEFKEKYGIDYANSIVAPVGTSEHHTGLAIDFAIKIENNFDLENKDIFRHIKIYQSVVPYLADFGFILRYPKGKEQITGFPYEPWHIRYVGKDAAKEIESNDWVLEEYIKDKTKVK